MAKGYWIGQADIADAQAYERYRQANAVAFQKYGARFIVRGGPQQVSEGAWRSRTVVLEFDSYEQAVACYESAEYQDALALRRSAATVDLVIVEGT